MITTHNSKTQAITTREFDPALAEISEYSWEFLGETCHSYSIKHGPDEWVSAKNGAHRSYKTRAAAEKAIKRMSKGA